MIQYALVCENAHRFDAWFGNAEAYEAQHARKLVTCPVCDSAHVEKALMAPAVRTQKEKVAVSAGHPEHQKIREALRALRRKVETEADYVGERFAEEARKIHYGEADQRGIYGEASRDEVTGLLEDGIEIMPLPVLPDDHN
ncbi:hypothetical protein GCM10007989_23270 [Devosia pacifica]|uniref:DUF1178 domain-containing protein n=1 Tax=Devosia pacifica TaxID=1335967 RepID=A0A918S8R7_9HYPH|nr:DUF1178 family protein [Devosia pacifica]GHA26802.1 hypothetical protein GCM10007989_23270 [Devosia pacifica]